MTVIQSQHKRIAKSLFRRLRWATGWRRRNVWAAMTGVGVTETELRKRLEQLRSEHRDLDAAIAALTEAGSTDQLQIARLKKRKLALRDQIGAIEDQLIPDIIA